MFDDIVIGDALPTFSRETDFSSWNRYAAVNDEFIDVHMSKEAAQAAGQADVFGMGNLRVAYAHAMLHDWLGNRGDVAQFSCQFRQLNFRGDVLDVHASVTGKARVDGHMLVDVALGVINQNGEETMPGSAQVVLFGDHAAMPAAPSRPAIPTREPGVHLDAETISWLGRPLEPLSSYPIDANDIRRWALTAYYPEPAPRELTELADASAGPWHELVALRDFNPFAWNQAYRPDIYPWMRGMGTEPGRRGLNGGQKSWYFAPMRVGDVITTDVTLIDAFEKEGRMGTMLFLVDEARWTNQRDELVRIGQRTSIYYERPEPMTEPPIVDLGAGIFALHDPHPGHERDFNRYYERDHMYAAAILAPWTIAGQRFVATADLKQLRYPADGPFGPIGEGSYLTMYWIVAGKLDEQQAWVSEQMKLLNAAGRTFNERSVQTATSYDYLGSWRRDPDGVPPFQALDRRYPSVVWAVVERRGDATVAELSQWLADDFLPASFASSPVALATMFTPRAKEPWWPAAAPEVPGVGERVFITLFLEVDVREIWRSHFADLGDKLDATGRCRTLMVAPFIPTVPGTDTYTDQLF